MRISNRPSRRCVRTGIILSGLLVSAIAVASSQIPSPGASNVNWADYLGGSGSAQYSELAEINRSNVQNLAVAWTYDFPGNGQSIGNPIVIGNRLYTVWSGGVVAIDATTGEELWQHTRSPVLMRGLNIWISPNRLDQRLFFHSADRLYALDALTGKVIESFGEKGSVDMRLGLDRELTPTLKVGSQAPGRVFGNLLILGSAGEGGPGYIRAFDVLSGRIVWTFHSIPHQEDGQGDWQRDAWRTQGGINNWNGMTLDEQAHILFVTFSGAKPNYYGVDRPGNNLYGNSIVALDPRNGAPLWHFQTLHHDLWDYDLPQAPKLLTLKRNGHKVKAVLVASKTGHIFVFERRTGKPVFPIEEQAVPQSDVPGENSAPTQPFPTVVPPFARQGLTVNDLSPMLDPAERARFVGLIEKSRNEGLFTPPSFRGSILSPGPWGGTNMDNGVTDGSGHYYVVSADIPGLAKLEPTGRVGYDLFLKADLGNPGKAVYDTTCAACHGADLKGQPPAIPPLIGVAYRRSEAYARDIITRGRNTMPPFELAPGDLDTLLAHLGYKVQPTKASLTKAAPPDEIAKQKPKSYQSSPNFLFSTRGLPATRGPWSTLTAYDMNVGKILWKVPYGSLPGMKESGQIFPRGAIIGTGGGLLFAGSQDRVLRAWDMKDGKVVWQVPLPSPPGGVPAVYRASGRQFIVVPAAQFDPEGPGASMGFSSPGRNSLVAFSLPQRK